MENGAPVKLFGTGKEHCDSINAGQYYVVVFGKGNFVYSSSFAYAPYTIEKAYVTEPTIESKVYNGSTQTADIADTERYTVIENNGGAGVKQNGYYDVVLELKDPLNYKWSTTDNAQVTLQFAITRAENEWTVNPSISGWTYGEARDDEKKLHPCLIPYGDLPESEKEYDRNTSLQTLKLIIKLGYKITK